MNGLNQYTAVGGTGFGYDSNGNLASDGVSSFSYDAENRLVAASGGVSLVYDPLGRLFQVTGGSGTTQFLYDGDALVAEYNGSGTMLRRYVQGPGFLVKMARRSNRTRAPAFSDFNVSRAGIPAGCALATLGRSPPNALSEHFSLDRADARHVEQRSASRGSICAFGPANFALVIAIKGSRHAKPYH